MKCQKCQNTATLHITEVLSENQFEELHLCEQCAHKYLYETQAKSNSPKGALAEHLSEVESTPMLAQQECPMCGLTFADFRNSGRLGCPNDYQEFKEELMPLLENIHGETKHIGKTPRRLPQTKQTQTELMHLRNKLKQAVTREDYEEAAKIRDRIRQLEES
jgi:protein arginine kinase activator